MFKENKIFKNTEYKKSNKTEKKSKNKLWEEIDIEGDYKIKILANGYNTKYPNSFILIPLEKEEKLQKIKEIISILLNKEDSPFHFSVNKINHYDDEYTIKEVEKTKRLITNLAKIISKNENINILENLAKEKLELLKIHKVNENNYIKTIQLFLKDQNISKEEKENLKNLKVNLDISHKKIENINHKINELLNL